MATIQELIAGIEVEKEAAEKREHKARKEIEVILATAQQEGRSALTDEEDARCEQLFDNIELAKANQAGITQKLARARKVEAEEIGAEARLKDVRETAPRRPQARDQIVSIGREERTYTKESDPRGQTFLRDIARQFMYGDVEASTRLARHSQEERVERAGQMSERALVGAGTSAFSGLVVPQYLVDMVAPAVAGLRPFADICNKHPLPADGMSVNISRITTASTAGLQPSEFTQVSGTDMDDTLMTVNVQTAAGSQLLSRQAIDRGTGIEDTVLQDLFARYATVLDNTLITQAVTGLSATATANVLATATGVALYPKLMAASAGVEGALMAYGQPSHAVMHSRRWYWLAKEMTTSWPLINSQGIEPRTGGELNPNSSYNSGLRGVLPNGLGVVVDNNIATTLGGGTEDEIYVVPARECHLWEDASAPALIRAEQPSAGTLGVLFVVFGYFAYTFGRYANAMQKVSGAGLIAPVF